MPRRLDCVAFGNQRREQVAEAQTVGAWLFIKGGNRLIEASKLAVTSHYQLAHHECSGFEIWA